MTIADLIEFNSLTTLDVSFCGNYLVRTMAFPFSKLCQINSLSGEPGISPIFSQIKANPTYINSKIYVGTLQGFQGIFDLITHEMLSPAFAEITEIYPNVNVYIAKENKYFALYDLKTHKKLSPDFNHINAVYPKAMVYVAAEDNKAAIYDLLTHQKLSPESFDTIDIYPESKIYVGETAGKFAIYDLITHKRLSPFFDRIMVYPESGIYVAQNGPKWELHKLGSNKKLPESYAAITNVYPEIQMYIAQTNCKYAMYNLKTQEKLSPDYNFIENVYPDLNIYVAKKENKYAIYNLQTHRQISMNMDKAPKVDPIAKVYTIDGITCTLTGERIDMDMTKLVVSKENIAMVNNGFLNIVPNSPIAIDYSIKELQEYISKFKPNQLTFCAEKTINNQKELLKIAVLLNQTKKYTRMADEKENLHHFKRHILSELKEIYR